jgi:hypothetical protein
MLGFGVILGYNQKSTNNVHMLHACVCTCTTLAFTCLKTLRSIFNSDYGLQISTAVVYATSFAYRKQDTSIISV